jgi:hypothetical protein
VAEPYKIGERTTDVMLEILNLDKKDVISIDEISNQEFSEVIKHTALCTHLSFGVSVLSLFSFSQLLEFVENKVFTFLSVILL